MRPARFALKEKQLNPVPSMRRLRPLCLAVSLLLAVPVAHAADKTDTADAGKEPAADAAHAGVFAIVNGKEISSREYQAAFTNLVRQKFYHGQVPEDQLAQAREETKNKLVQRVLLLEEVARRGILPDEKKVDETIAGYEKQYADSPAWQEKRERLLPDLKKQLGEQSQLARLEDAVRKVPEPTEADAKAYYDAHPDLFTEPEKLRMSAILLSVDPSSPSTTWESTREEARAIYKRLLAGADFSEAAKLHSNSKYAESGGDMGYLHRGMIPEALQSRIDSFELGKVNEPIDTLEGVAIFRLDERVPAKKREFTDVAQRASELLVRERQQQAWKDLIDKLMASAEIKLQIPMGTERRDGGG